MLVICEQTDSGRVIDWFAMLVLCVDAYIGTVTDWLAMLMLYMYVHADAKRLTEMLPMLVLYVDMGRVKRLDLLVLKVHIDAGTYWSAMLLLWFRSNLTVSQMLGTHIDMA